MYRERDVSATDVQARQLAGAGFSALSQQLEAWIVKRLEAPPAVPTRLEAAMRRSMLTPGKRVRGLLVMLVAESWGRDPDLALDVAVAIEMIHAASLILDDLPAMDNSPERRGLPACHVEFGQSTAILAAVAIMSAAFAVVAADARLPADKKLALVDVLNRAIGPDGMAGGQDLDLNPVVAELGVHDVERMHAAKTGALFEAAALAGTIVAGIDGPRRALMADFGMRLGLGFQALDDLADQADDAARLVTRLGPDLARQRAENHISVARECLAASGADSERLAEYVDRLLALLLEHAP